jgi:hypothetical protein
MIVKIITFFPNLIFRTLLSIFANIICRIIFNKYAVMFLLVVFLLTRCASHNQIDTELSYQDFQRECSDVLAELRYAKEYEKTIHQDDRFKARYMLIVPALLEINKISRETRAAAAKIKSLEALSGRLKCYKVSSEYQTNEREFSPYQEPNNPAPALRRKNNFIPEGVKSNYNKIKKYNPF